MQSEFGIEGSVNVRKRIEPDIKFEYIKSV